MQLTMLGTLMLLLLQGEYIGTEVAIKEVLPNNTYDVEKYFERECVLMK